MTGSTCDIGLGIACKLAAQGANAALNGFGDVASALRLIGEFDVRNSYHDADMSQPLQIEALLTQAARESAAVDVLANNSGIQHVANVEGLLVERWGAVIAINLARRRRSEKGALRRGKQAWSCVLFYRR